MEEQNKFNKESWEGILDIYFKPINAKAFPVKVFVPFVKVGLNKDKKPQLIFDVHYEGSKYKFDCNKTNMAKLISLGMTTPKMIENKQITFEKIRVQNPSTNQMVDSLAVVKIE